jgi:hypothetical protein
MTAGSENPVLSHGCGRGLPHFSGSVRIDDLLPECWESICPDAGFPKNCPWSRGAGYPFGSAPSFGL